MYRKFAQRRNALVSFRFRDLLGTAGSPTSPAEMQRAERQRMATVAI